MALTKELIVAIPSLASLSEEQIKDLVTVSTNNEDEVIGKRFGEVYRELDATIEKTTGIKRDGAEKTYNYLERATTEYANKFKDYDELKGKVNTLTEEKNNLEKQIAKGGDDALKEQLERVQKELTATKVQFNDLQTKYDDSEKAHAKALNDYKIQSEISRARGELKIKSGVNETVLDALSERAIANVVALNPSFEERNGKEVLVYHNPDGSPLNNEKNLLKPYTTKELLEREFGAMDLLDKGSAGGAGGKETKPNGGSTLIATTKSEADNEIHKILSADGYTRGTSEYQERYNKMYTENKVSELPE